MLYLRSCHAEYGYMVDREVMRVVLSRVVNEQTWSPPKGSEEEEAVLQMAEMGWLVAAPDRSSGIGVAERGMDRYYQWGGSAAA